MFGGRPFSTRLVGSAHRSSPAEDELQLDASLMIPEHNFLQMRKWPLKPSHSEWGTGMKLGLKESRNHGRIYEDVRTNQLHDSPHYYDPVL